MTMTGLPKRTLHLTALAVPLAGWTLHTTVLHRRLTQAHQDPLTGTWRREAFTDRARRILHRHPDEVVLVLGDADRFKDLNDRYGHAAGDTVLAAIGHRLTEWAGTRGVTGRLGGDEFAALARIEPRHQHMRLEHLNRLMAAPVPYGDGLLPIGVSLGAATPATTGTSDLPALMRAADSAMYEGKHTGNIIQARPDHTNIPAVNGRRAGRPGTAALGRAA
ncbi:GGDEF domain-containing protein [Streptomyces cyaneofuscatus]|uniref:GGDEF domain-containing protein n=1 Tax=Streptomyces cyaneofuscatus TaxID=66883 RepID=UPI0036C6C3BF